MLCLAVFPVFRDEDISGCNSSVKHQKEFAKCTHCAHELLFSLYLFKVASLRMDASSASIELYGSFLFSAEKLSAKAEYAGANKISKSDFYMLHDCFRET